ncbi:MAG: hypothetical protein HYY18_08770 [Planctomycetes bacterium]|nr:hypothetical protein [Planctomycetota bacterium]
MTTARFVFGISAWALAAATLLAVPGRLERERALRAAAEDGRAAEAAAVNRRLSALSGEKRILMEALGAAGRDADKRRSEREFLESKLTALERERDAAVLARDTLQAELLTSQDRLEKAWSDIAQMEKQIVEVSRKLNAVQERLERFEPSAEARIGGIDRIVLGVSDKVNLVLISVGGKDSVKVGDKFKVYRGDTYISTLVVDKVEDRWAACRELKDLAKETIQQGDDVSRRVFDK